MLSNNQIEDKKRHIQEYCSSAAESIESAMNIVECDDTLNDHQNEEIAKLYEKLSSISKLLDELTD